MPFHIVGTGYFDGDTTTDMKRQSDECRAAIVLPIQRCSPGYAIRAAAGHGGTPAIHIPVHVPDLRLAAYGVMPNDIRREVVNSIHIVGRDDAPRRIDENGVAGLS